MSKLAPVALVSTLARFVQGDIKGGTHAHAYRMDTMRAAIEQAFKGNYSPITEAAALTEGKAKKARAYHAGFAALGGIGSLDSKGVGVVKVAYVGKLDSNDNKAARETILSKTATACGLFFAAFDVVMAEKATPKAKPVAAPAPAAAPATTEGDAPAMDADTLRHDMAVEQEETVCKVAAMLNLGLLTGQQVDLLNSALAAHANKLANAAPALLAA
jgi:hypothetical protein